MGGGGERTPTTEQKAGMPEAGEVERTTAATAAAATTTALEKSAPENTTTKTKTRTVVKALGVTSTRVGKRRGRQTPDD